MNKTMLLLIVSAFTALAAIFIIQKNSQNQGSKALNTNKAVSDAALVQLYTNLFYSTVANDVSRHTVALGFIDQNDSQSARRMLLIWLESDMAIINLKTNHPWSVDEQKVIGRARQYLASEKLRKP